MDRIDQDNLQFTMWVSAYEQDILAFVLWVKWQMELEGRPERSLRETCRQLEMRSPDMVTLTMVQIADDQVEPYLVPSLKVLLADDPVSDKAPRIDKIPPLDELI